MNIDECRIGMDVEIDAPDPKRGLVRGVGFWSNLIIYERNLQGQSGKIADIDRDDHSARVTGQNLNDNNNTFHAWILLAWLKNPEAAPSQTKCQCALWGSCHCGAFAAEMAAQGKVYNQALGLWTKP